MPADPDTPPGDRWPGDLPPFSRVEFAPTPAQPGGPSVVWRPAVPSARAATEAAAGTHHAGARAVAQTWDDTVVAACRPAGGRHTPAAPTLLAAGDRRKTACTAATLPDQPEPGDCVFRTYIALMLFLFAFFALVARNDRPDPEKWALAADSLRATFAAGPETRIPADTATLAASRFLARLGDDLAPSLGLDAVELLPGSDGMRIKLRREWLFAEASARPRPSAALLADRLATAAAAPPAGMRVDLQAQVPVAVTDAPRLARQRAAALARWLIDRGAPATAVGVGLAEDGNDAVILLVRVFRMEQSRPLRSSAAPNRPPALSLPSVSR